jgi:hypothetical protein
MCHSTSSLSRSNRWQSRRSVGGYNDYCSNGFVGRLQYLLWLEVWIRGLGGDVVVTIGGSTIGRVLGLTYIAIVIAVVILV